LRVVRVPYLRTTPARLQPWEIKVGADFAPLPEQHPGWDATVDLHLRRHVFIDGAKVREQSGLGADATVRLVAGWRSELAREKCLPYRHGLSPAGNFEGTVDLQVPGSRLAASVVLVLGLVLVHAGKDASRLSARAPGSWLWVDEQELRLERTRGRFPMEWADFGASGLSADAPWFLDWPNQEWSAPLLGSLRLKLNKTNPTMSELLDLPDEDPRRKLVIRSAILDVAKQLVIAALSSDDFVANEQSFPDASVGASVRALIAMALPSTSLAAARSQMRDHAGAFHMRLQAGIVPFRGGIE
jgi:hypothetical protein